MGMINPVLGAPRPPNQLERPPATRSVLRQRHGGIRWNRCWVNVSTVSVGEYVGLKGIDDAIWNVYFDPVKLGRLLERQMRIEEAYG